MSHQFAFLHYDEYNCGNVEKKANFCEADHADEFPLNFGLPLVKKLTKPVKFSQDEEILSKTWMTYITNFAKFG